MTSDERDRTRVRVTREGLAEEAKLGPLLLADSGEEVWLLGLGEAEPWPRGERVWVSGVLDRDHGVPTFIGDAGAAARRGEPIPQGVFLPEPLTCAPLGARRDADPGSDEPQAFIRPAPEGGLRVVLRVDAWELLAEASEPEGAPHR